MPFVIGIIIAVTMLLAVEIRLRGLGIEPNVRDSPELWAAQRELAAQLGNQAIIVVGDSRGQLDIDLPTLKEATGLTPVQLAIDGSWSLPVLADLAADPRITGTIIVDTSAGKLIPQSSRDRSHEWTEFYQKKYRGLLSPAIETRLKGFLQEKSALYSSMIPLDRLPGILFSNNKYSSTYLKTRSDRQRDGDYRLVKMPDFYVARVIRHFGGQQLLKNKYFRSFAEFDSSMREQIAGQPARDPGADQKLKSEYEGKLSYVHSLVKQIQARNGRIFFVRFPSDKLVWLIDDYRQPRWVFWDTFAQTTSATAVHFQDFPDLRKYSLPDGSHLDQRDKKSFTTALVAALSLKKAGS
ncbi:MAG: hypothetical protein KKB30_10780 [Proteobacteria bacterium]|nr:hypothetical protein [Pseudomonadota bacterium]MBU1714515.1 hypothetical protein [Pseudomonadota bacterium]